MDNGTISLVIAILSLIVGTPPFIKWLYPKAPTLYLVLDENTNLLNQVTNSIDGLKITYNEVDVSKNVFLMKAFICYIGDRDIINNKFNITLPVDSKIHNFRFIYKSEDLNVNTYINNNAIEFESELIKNREFMYFEALVHLSSHVSPYKLKSRIIGVNNYDTINFGPIRYNALRKMNNLVFVMLIFSSVPLLQSYVSEHALKGKSKYETIISNNNMQFDSDNTFIEINKFNRLVKNINLKEIPKDSVLVLSKLGEQQQKFLNLYNEADSILNAQLDLKPNYLDIESYNILRSSYKFPLKDKYYVEFKNRLHWFEIAYVLTYSFVFLYLLSTFRNFSKENKLIPIMNLIYEYKNKK